MAYIIGKKLGMTQIYKDDGTVVPVTVIYAEPMRVSQIKTHEIDGYTAIQVAYALNRKTKKPQVTHLKKAGIEKGRMKEFRIENIKEFSIGDILDLSKFETEQKVKITSISKAKGFQGVVKRHGFSGAPASHGHKSMLRRLGSTGQRFPQHTLKGQRMPGRMGGVKTTISGLKIIDIDVKANTITIKGAVPGYSGAMLSISTQ